jgi:hypothetical protein
MKALRTWILRFGGLFSKQRKDRELDEEIESDVQLRIEDNLRLGMTPEGARRQALIALGGIESTKEAYRDQRGVPVLETLWRDLHFATHTVRENAGSTAVAGLTLALGIGANSAIFSLVDAVLIKELPVRDPKKLAVLDIQNEREWGVHLDAGSFGSAMIRRATATSLDRDNRSTYES